VPVVLARRAVREARNVDGGAAVVTRAQISHISEEQRSIDFLFWSLSGLKSEIAMAPLRLLGEKPSSFNRSLDDA